jgi:Zn-dependent protease
LPPLNVVLLIFAMLLISLSVHEAAHAWTANQLGDPTARQLGRITLNPLAHIDWIGTVLFPLVAMLSGLPLLGWAKPVPVNWHYLKNARRDYAIIAAAGPLSNLLLAAIGAAIYRALDATDTPPLAALQTAGTFVGLNVLLAVFNMLPVPPLDGGNVLGGLLPESGARMIDQLRPYGFIILYALLLTGVLSQFVLPIANAIEEVLL